MRIARAIVPGAVTAVFGLISKDMFFPMRLGREEGPAIDPARPGIPFTEITLLAPCLPSKIVAIGLNYRAHAEEMGKPLPIEPLIFLKPPTAVIGPGDEIVLPQRSQRVDYEGELAIVISKQCRNVSIDDAKSCILGYTCFNDVTARDLQTQDVQYTRAKGFDTFAPLGPWIETEIDADDTTIETRVNGRTVQRSSTSDMIYNVARLVSHVSSVMTLQPGDVIPTGTPSGIGPLVAGDRVEIEIAGIGTLTNTVRT